MDALPLNAVHPDEISRAPKVYGQPKMGGSLFEVGASVVPFVAIWTAMWLALVRVGRCLVLLLAVAAAGFLVRLFLIQHD